jgi:hypothetical protein
MSCVDLKSYTSTLYHKEELKSLTRYRFDKISERAKLKSSVSRLVTILFPELEKLVPTLHLKTVYSLLSEFPSAKHIAEAHLTRLTNLLHEASKGRYGKDKAVEIREVARHSIGSVMPAKSLELKHTIKLIGELSVEIKEIEAEIKKLVDETGTTLLTIPGLSYNTVAVILAEVGDFSNFATPDKVLAFAGMSPSTYQSGQLTNLLCPHGKARVKISQICSVQCSQIRLQMGQNLCRLPCQKASRGQALQRCSVSRSQETGQTDICFGEISFAVSACRLIFSFRYFFKASFLMSALLCLFSVFKIEKNFWDFFIFGVDF